MAFRFEKLTVKGQEALQLAQEIAEQHGHQQLTPLHLLKALLDEEQGIVRPVIQKIGANVGQLETMVASELSRLPKVSGTNVQPAAAPATVKVLEKAQQLADQMKDAFVSTEHLLLGTRAVGRSGAAAARSQRHPRGRRAVCASRPCAAPSRSSTRIRRTSTRPCSVIPPTWSRWPGRGRSTRSSAATPRFAA